MRGRAIVLFLAVVSVPGAAACALVAGIEEPTDRPPDAAVGDDVSSPEADAQGMSAADGCAHGGPEICTDGIDNDCNGLTDCADPACTALGYACVPPVPSGWTYDAVDMTDAASSCPAGYGSQPLVVSASGGPAVCGCSCNVGKQPDCVTGTILASVGVSSCTAGGMIGFVQTDGQCQAQTPTSNVPTNLGALPLDAGGTCSASPTKTVPSRSETDWLACSGPLGAGCDGGQVCAIAGRAFTACVVGPGDAGCPPGYSTRSTPGTGVSDTRDCSACACAAVPSGTTCDNATLSFWSNSSCSGPAFETVPVDGGCEGTGGAAYGSFQYSADAVGTATCGVPTQSPTPTGGVSVTGQVSACCVP